MEQPSPTTDGASGSPVGNLQNWRARFRRFFALAKPARHVIAKVARVLFLVHCVAGPISILWLAMEPAARIGEGRLDEWLRRVELIDFHWWIVLGVGILWAIPLLLAIAYARARHSVLQLERLKESVARVLRETSIPVTVDVDHTVPVDIGHPLKCPVKMEATFTMEREVEVSVDIPVSLTIPVETVVETKVLGLGTVSIPIKSEIPIDLVYPFRNTVKMKMEDLPVTIEEEVEVIIPVFEIPLQCRLETQLDLMSNLRPLREFLAGTDPDEGADEEEGD